MPVKRLFNWLTKIFSNKPRLRIGLIGAPNSGKTTLANRICLQWCDEHMGEVSDLPHETRVVQSKDHVGVRDGRDFLRFDLYDTPGLATHEDLWDHHHQFIMYGLNEEHAHTRLEEARAGVVKSLKLLEDLDAVVFVVDLSKKPEKQVGEILLEHLDSRGIPVVIAANKMDLVYHKPPEEDYHFFGHPVVPISALHGINMQRLYRKLYEHLTD